jgi:hypothetical protein
MEELKTFEGFLADGRAKEAALSQMRHLECESNYYQSRIQRDLKQFIREGSQRRDCSIIKRYNHLLQKTAQRSHASYANLNHFQRIV